MRRQRYTDGLTGQQRYYRRHKKRVDQRYRLWVAANLERVRAIHRKYARKAYADDGKRPVLKARVYASAKKACDELRDSYVMRRLSEREHIPRAIIPHGLVEVKRLHLKLGRKLKEIKHGPSREERR